MHLYRRPSSDRLRLAWPALCALVIGWTPPAAGPQGTTAQVDVIGREFTILVQGSDDSPTDAIGREFTLLQLEPSELEPSDSIAREFTAYVPTPDITLANVLIPNEGGEGTLFFVAWDTRNDGLAEADTTWIDRLSFSQPVLCSGCEPPVLDTTFDYSNLAPLAPGGRLHHVAGPFELPSVPSGDDHLDLIVQLETDATGVLVEEPASAEANNLFGPHTITVHPLPRPNLVVDVSQWPPFTHDADQNGSPDGYLSGEVLSMTFEVSNRGDVPTSLFEWTDEVRLYEDANADGNPDGAAIATWSYDSLSFLANDPQGTAPGSFYVQSTTAPEVRLPDGLLGTYLLEVATDAGGTSPDGEMSETIEADNRLTSPTFTIGIPPHPDLEPAAITILFADQNHYSGWPVQIEWETRNVAALASSAPETITEEVWLSTHTSLGQGQDWPLGSWSSELPGLPPGGSASRAAEAVLPVDLQTGTYYFIVRTDTTNRIPELDAAAMEQDGNNERAGAAPELVNLSGTPDLVPSQLDFVGATPPLLSGHAVQVEWTVTNPGAPGWGTPFQWLDALLIQNTQTLQTYPLGEYSESTVFDEPSGRWIVQGYDRQQSVVIPSDAPTGTYRLIVDVDASQSVFEFDPNFDAEANNRLVAGATFELYRNPADLIIVGQVSDGAGGWITPPSSAAPGATIQLPWTVTNIGAGAASADSWIDRVYLSRSPTVLLDAVLVVEQAHASGLAATASYDETILAQVPFVDPASDWYLLSFSDYFGQVFEENASNNVISVPFDVTNIASNLVPELEAVTTRVLPGEPLAARWMVRNEGVLETNATYWVDRLYLCDTHPDPALATVSIPIGSVPRSAGLDGPSGSPPIDYDEYAVEASFALPLGTPSGLWYVTVVTDADDQVFETSEYDYASTRTRVQVEGPQWANLEAANLAALTDSVTAGQELALSWAVRNVGAGPTDSTTWTDSFFLSNDTVLDQQDIFLGFFAHTSPLDAGEVRTGLTTSLVVPLGVAGEYRVLVQVNSNGAVDEGGQTLDNLTFDPDLLSVQLPPITDLQIESAAHAETLLLGDEFKPTWVTRNQSGFTVPAEWSWSDDFWIVPLGESFPSPSARRLGMVENRAGTIPAGGLSTDQSPPSPLRIPGVKPGSYKLVLRCDVLGQVLELEEGLVAEGDDNVFVSSTPLTLKARRLYVDGDPLTLPLRAGDARWIELPVPADCTIDVHLEHSDPEARCEVFVRHADIPNPGEWDFASEGIGSTTPWSQSVRIPRSQAGSYYLMVRAVDGVGSAVQATLRATALPYRLEDVQPSHVGAGLVTLRLIGEELWRANEAELRPIGGGASIQASELHDGEQGERLALFDLNGSPLGDYEVVLIDSNAVGGPVESRWQDPLHLEPPTSLGIGLELEVSPNVRRGERGFGRISIRNLSNINLPFGAVTLAHLRPPTAVGPVPDTQRVVVRAAELGLDSIPSDGTRDSLVYTIAGLGPSQVHEFDVELDVGADFVPEETMLSLAGAPYDAAQFVGVGGFLQTLAEQLRLAVLADTTTPSGMAALAANPANWQAALDLAIASGALAPGAEDVWLPSSLLQPVAAHLEQLAEAIGSFAGLPAGQEMPGAALDIVAARSWCAPFSGPLLDCDSLFPVELGDEPHHAFASTFEGLLVPVGRVRFATPAPLDPNVKIRPIGSGARAIVNGNQSLRYQIHFENDAFASAWASRVEMVDAFEPEFRGSSLRFHEIRIGEYLFTYPQNTSYVQEQHLLLIDAETQTLVQISAGLQAEANQMFLEIQALDPLTGLPVSSGSEGFLPPNSEAVAGSGTGYVTFSVAANPNTTAGGFQEVARPSSGVRMRNRARIRLNAEPPIETPSVENLLDTGPPVSELTLGPITGTNLPLSWSADDSEELESGLFEGCGVASYSLWVREVGGGQWQPLLLDTNLTQAEFSGQPDTVYEFRLEARDRVGNQEDAPHSRARARFPRELDGSRQGAAGGALHW